MRLVPHCAVSAVASMLRGAVHAPMAFTYDRNTRPTRPKMLASTATARRGARCVLVAAKSSFLPAACRGYSISIGHAAARLALGRGVRCA